MNRIYQQALYYSNIPLRDRSIKAVVHLENTDDVHFGATNSKKHILADTPLRLVDKSKGWKIINISSSLCCI